MEESAFGFGQQEKQDRKELCDDQTAGGPQGSFV